MLRILKLGKTDCDKRKKTNISVWYQKKYIHLYYAIKWKYSKLYKKKKTICRKTRTYLQRKLYDVLNIIKFLLYVNTLHNNIIEYNIACSWYNIILKWLQRRTRCKHITPLLYHVFVHKIIILLLLCMQQ